MPSRAGPRIDAWSYLTFLVVTMLTSQLTKLMTELVICRPNAPSLWNAMDEPTELVMDLE